MITDWIVTGHISYSDSSLSKMDAVWPGLTTEEAQKKVDETVRSEMRKKKVVGVSIEATSHSKNWLCRLQKVELKND